MVYRSRNEIMSQILGAAANSGTGITQTRVMYKVYLSHTQLKEYLTHLIDNDLLYYDSIMRKFKTTEKGLKFLQAYNQIDGILKKEEE
jgi:predicted transcriptional regulator